MYWNEIWDSGYPYVESFETDPKNQILAKFGQNDGLIWPILGQSWKKNQIGSILHQKNGIFKILHILKHLTEIWKFGHLAK